MDNNKIPVAASDVGEAAYCPMSLYLKKRGAIPSDLAQENMAIGEEGHIQQTAYVTDRRCYVATHVFGHEHVIVHRLRVWRDTALMPTWYGRLFVRWYYFLSPILIRGTGRWKWFNDLARFLLRKFTRGL